MASVTLTLERLTAATDYGRFCTSLARGREPERQA